MDKESAIPKRGMSVSTEDEKPGKHDEGRKDEAKTIYRKVLELGPGSPEAAEARAKLGL